MPLYVPPASPEYRLAAGDTPKSLPNAVRRETELGNEYELFLRGVRSETSVAMPSIRGDLFTTQRGDYVRVPVSVVMPWESYRLFTVQFNAGAADGSLVPVGVLPEGAFATPSPTYESVASGALTPVQGQGASETSTLVQPVETALSTEVVSVATPEIVAVPPSPAIQERLVLDDVDVDAYYQSIANTAYDPAPGVYGSDYYPGGPLPEGWYHA